MLKRWFVFVLFCTSLSSFAISKDYDLLSSYLSDFHTMTASFHQTVTFENGQQGESSSGEMKLQRPQSFYWRVRSPSDQTVIADGDYIWIYDPDLEQVIRRKQETHQTMPALLLSGQLDALRDEIQVTSQLHGSQATFVIKFEHKDQSFNQVVMKFIDRQIVSMTIHDALGQINVFSFRQVVKDRPIASSWFEFKPPKGVDVMIES